MFRDGLANGLVARWLLARRATSDLYAGVTGEYVTAAFKVPHCLSGCHRDQFQELTQSTRSVPLAYLIRLYATVFHRILSDSINTSKSNKIEAFDTPDAKGLRISNHVMALHELFLRLFFMLSAADEIDIKKVNNYLRTFLR